MDAGVFHVGWGASAGSDEHPVEIWMQVIHRTLPRVPLEALEDQVESYRRGAGARELLPSELEWTEAAP